MEELDLNNIPSNIYIFGAGRIGKAVAMTLKSLDIIISGVVVSNKDRNFKDIEGIRVYSLEEYKQISVGTSLILAVREQYVEEIIAEIDNINIEHIYGVDIDKCVFLLEKRLDKKWLNKLKEYKELISKEEYLFFMEKKLRSRNLTIEVNVADACNLNCQSCNHFSPLAEEKYLDVDMYTKDLSRIYEIYGDKIGKLMLLGGEPLLNKNITEIMRVSRKILGEDCTIKIVTNGLLLSNMSEEFWSECIESNISLEYTKYPVHYDYSSIEKRIKERGVSIFNESDEKVKTTYKLPLVDSDSLLDPNLNYIKCNLANQCIVLKEGRLYPCPISANIEIFNSYYNKKYPTISNGIDIYKYNYDDIEAFLAFPIPMCQYCDICNYKYNIPWKVSKKEISEWM